MKTHKSNKESGKKNVTMVNNWHQQKNGDNGSLLRLSNQMVVVVISASILLATKCCRQIYSAFQFQKVKWDTECERQSESY